MDIPHKAKHIYGGGGGAALLGVYLRMASHHSIFCLLFIVALLTTKYEFNTRGTDEKDVDFVHNGFFSFLEDRILFAEHGCNWR